MKIQPYILLSLLAAFGFALSSLCNKFASKHQISNNWVLLFYYYLTVVPFLLFFPVLFRVTIPTVGWNYIFLYALAFFIGNIFFTKAIYQLDASTFAPFFQLQTAFIAIFAFFFLNEHFSLTNYFFLAAMVIGSILVSLTEKMSLKSYFSLATLLIILQQVFHAASNIFAGLAVKNMNSFTFMFWGDLTASFLALLLIPFLGFTKLKVSFLQIRPLLLGSFFATIAAVSLFTAFQTNVTLSSALALLTSPIVLILTVLASRFRPDLLEYHTRKVYLVRAIGVIIILLSAIKLSLP